MLTAVPRWETSSQQVPAHGRINVGLYDYLSKQVLDQQPPHLRDFLLAASVLEELGPKLCTEVLDVDQPEVLMDQIQVRNLFALEFEGAERRLRFHDLFREFLRASLQRRDEARYRELTLRAAKAYAARHEWERAVSRYLDLEMWEPVVEIIQQTADQLFNAGRRDTLAGWIDALPEELLASRPQILLHRCKIYTERGEPAAALALYEQAEQAYTTAGDRVGLARTLATKSVLLRFQGRYAEALAHCDRTAELTAGSTTQEQLARALAYRNAGLCKIRTGKLAGGLEALGQSLAIYEQVDALYDVSMIHHDLGLSSELAGDLDGAAEHYRAALQSWKQIGVPGPWANTLNGLGVVYYLQGKYDEAKAVLHEALTRSQQAGDLRVEAFAWASLGDLHRDLGIYEQAREAYEQALEIAERAHVGFIVTYALDALGNTYRLQGNLAQAYEHLRKALSHAQEHNSAYETGLCQMSFGILVSEEGDLSAAQTHLQQAIEQLEAGGYTRDLARAYLHLSNTIFQAGDRNQALEYLKQTLALTGQLGSAQYLAIEGLQMQPLLRFAIEQGIGAKLLPRVLTQIETYEAQRRSKPEPVVETKPEPSLIIHGLGQPWVELDGERVQWATVQSRDLFFCLLQHEQGLRKEELGEIFWPEHTPVKLDNIFRSTVYRLRRALYRDSVVFEDGVYRFNRDSDYRYDVETFEQFLNEAGLGSREEPKLIEEAIALYEDDYLEGIYGEWCELERERLRGRYMTAQQALARLYTDRRNLTRAVEMYQQILAQDPFREAAHRGLMQCYYRQGDRAAAIRQYQVCAEVLREELGLSPSPETEALYVEIIS
jgi:ATP/maltotriose-dependent transcriptional regulator MalT